MSLVTELFTTGVQEVFRHELYNTKGVCCGIDFPVACYARVHSLMGLDKYFW